MVFDESIMATREVIDFLKSSAKILNAKSKLKMGAGLFDEYLGILVTPNTVVFKDIIQLLFDSGDEFLRRVKYHTASDGGMKEQWNSETGFNQGAADLTWSYTAFCTMKNSRDAAKRAIKFYAYKYV
ncbi:Glucoamylase, intracellular sporulation-specific [Smittium culicis]|uniref:glucan 1,4-alpha-glucosidase n=1 Tax=Smittium culicis TaxID=133412 RepID=A0A1R1X9A7_9FUNG|nr:Glucoamylase, intracellular sporulation-specific [Smittium culicis]